MKDLSNKEIKVLDTFFKYTRPRVFLGTILQQIIDTLQAGVDDIRTIPEGSPVNAVNAHAKLTINDAVVAGETLTIDNPAKNGVDIYEFAADTALSVGEGHKPIDINDGTVKATVNLTVVTNPTTGNTMLIGEKVFTFVPKGTGNADGEIDVEDDLVDTQVNIIAAIKGLDDHNEPHPLVTCGAQFDNDVLQITALIGGSAGNEISVSETFTDEDNGFTDVSLKTGSDCDPADAITALITAINELDTQDVEASVVVGDTTSLILTAKTAGLSGNTVAILTDMPNGSFEDNKDVLSGGTDGTVGADGEVMADSDYLYICRPANTISGKNWHRIAFDDTL